MAAGADDLRPRQLARIAQPVGHTLGARARGHAGLGDVREVFLRARLRSRGVRRFGAVPRAGRARDRARRASFGGGVDSVPPTVVEGGGTRGPASRPRAAVRSFLPRACDSSDAARVDPDGWGASLGSDVAGWARASVRLPHDDVYHTLEEDEEDWERARAAGALPSRRDRPDVSAPRASPLPHRAARPPRRRRPRRRRARSPLDRRDRGCGAPRRARQKPARDRGGARRRRSHHARVARRHRANPRRARRRRPSLRRRRRTRSPRRRRRDSPRRRERPRACARFSSAKTRIRGRRAREPVSGTRGSSIDGSAVSIDDGSNATRVPRRDATRGIRTVGDFDERRAVAMSEVDASAALARVVAEALLRPTNTPNGYDLSGWPDQTSTPVVEGDEETATATTMAAESAAVDALAGRRGKSRAEHRDATSRRTRRAGDAHEGGCASDRVEWGVRGARGDAVRGDARGAGGGGGGRGDVLVARRVSPTRRARARSIGGARGDGDGERAGENGGTRGRRGGRCGEERRRRRRRRWRRWRRRNFCSRTSSGSRRDPDLRASLHRLAI